MTNVMYCNTCGTDYTHPRCYPYCGAECRNAMFAVAPRVRFMPTPNEIIINNAINYINKLLSEINKYRWSALRVLVFEKFGKICLKCGSIEQICVDHIKPKSKYPELAYEFNNLQPLCWPCNKKKSFIDETDYR